MENTRGAGQGAPASESSRPRRSIEDVISEVRNTATARLWRLDKLEVEPGVEVEVLIGRAPTRDGSRTFPAVVIRLLRDGQAVRDYVLTAPAAYYVYAWLSQANERKLDAFAKFAGAFRAQSRVVKAEEEDLEAEG